MNPFFPRQAIPTTFSLYTLITLVMLHTEFGLIWITPWPDEKELFLKLSKFCNSRNSQNSVWKPIFPRQVIPTIFSALHCYYTGDIQYRFWFDLDNSLTRWKIIIFKILKSSQFAKFAKLRMKTPFLPRQALQTTFLLYTLITLVKLNTECGLIWTTPWPDEKKLFLKFSIFRNSRNLQNSVWKPIFFPRQALQTFFCFTLSLHWWNSIPSLVWFVQLLKPMKKT